MRKIATLAVLIMLILGSGAAAFEENMQYEESAQANVDRPMINHVKVFLNNYIPPLYNLIFGSGSGG